MIKKVERKSVSDAVLEEVKRLILSGEWKEGSKIPSENELANMMGVSRVSVRSALQRLSSLGLIESRQGGGTFVRRMDGTQNLNMIVPMILLSGENQKHMVEFRRIIESEAAYLTAERATDEDIARLKKNWKEYQEVESVNTMSEDGLHLDVEFHTLITEMTKNPMFQQLGVLLKDTMENNIRYVWGKTDKSYALESHGDIIAAIEKRDPKRARQAMWNHMDIVWNLIKNE